MVEPMPGGEEEAVLENVNDHHYAFDDVEAHGDGFEPEGESLVARTRRGIESCNLPWSHCRGDQWKSISWSGC